jgi:hypothetical protein
MMAWHSSKPFARDTRSSASSARAARSSLSLMQSVVSSRSAVASWVEVSAGSTTVARSALVAAMAPLAWVTSAYKAEMSVLS